MKNFYLKLSMLFLAIMASTSLLAVDYIVSGAGTTAVNGTYEENGTLYNGKPQYIFGDYFLNYHNSRWEIWKDGYMGADTYYYTEVSGSVPPSSGWTVNWAGSSPAPSVAPNSGAINYNPEAFTESIDNDGTIENSVTILSNNYSGLTFTGTNGDDFVSNGKVIVSNLPAGLTAVITKTNSLELTATLSGTAPNHSSADDVNNLTFTFQNSAFSNGDASVVENAAKNDLQVNFRSVINIGSGGDYSTIAAGISNAGSGDILELSAETFTETNTINKDLVIIGQDAETTIVQANANQLYASYPVFIINTGLSVTIKNVTIQNGNNKTSTGGGGIYSGSDELTIMNSKIINNTCSKSGGGGIYIYSGTLSLNNCTISNNSVKETTGNARGGGLNIYNVTETEIINSTISGNTCESTIMNVSQGGGISIWNGITRIINSTISGNTCDDKDVYGGGIYCLTGTMDINESTISGNTCETTSGTARYNEGGAIYVSQSNNAPTVTITNSTIHGNSSGFYFKDPNNNDPTLTISNTILASNGTSYDYHVENGVTLVDNGCNIVENQTCYRYPTLPDDWFFNKTTDILYSHDYQGNEEGATGLGWNKNDAGISGSLNISSTLADNNTLNGTQTLAISSPSFAIGAGLYDVSEPNDQRGATRLNPPTIGAYDYGASFTYTVTSAADDGGATTLRGIINNAAVIDGDVIEFDVATMGTNSITLATPLLIEKNLTISASGSDNGIVLDGNNVTQVLQIGSSGGATPTVTLKNIKITGGDDDGDVVGGIENYGDLTMINCVVSDNTDTDMGAEMGAIGGIYSEGNLTLINTTVTNNTGASSGYGIGGIYCAGDLIFKNSILYGNVGESNNIASSIYISSYHSLFEETRAILEDAGNAFDADTDNEFEANPKFQGSTINPTHPYAILGVSPCADAGNNDYCTETTDIRGFDRTLNKTTGATGGTIDMGAYEYKFGVDPNNVLTWTGSSTTAWNTSANWDGNVLPGSGDIVNIPGSLLNYPELSGTANCNDLTVETGATLTINSGASLITNGTITNNGTIDIKRDITDNKWHLISSPITNATATIFDGDYMQNWNESTANWSDITLSSEPLTPAKGFSMYHLVDPKIGGTTYTFSGTPNTGDQSIAVTYTEVPGGGNDGANLLGNPYPSSIDWSGLDDTYGAVYYWNGSAYVSWNDNVGSGSQYVASMQGFFIVTSSAGTFSLSNSDRTHLGASSYYKSTKTANNSIVLAASNGSYQDKLYIRFDENSTADFELQRDAYKFLSSTNGIAQLYAMSGDDILSIDTRPQTESIQLGFVNNEAGTYSIAIKEIADISTAILEDTKLNIFHNLSDGAYNFDWVLNDDEIRFKLHCNTTAVEEISLPEMQVYVAAGNIIIKSQTTAQRIILTDITGRTLGVWESVESIPAPKTAGVYLVSIESDGQRITEKLIVE